MLECRARDYADLGMHSALGREADERMPPGVKIERAAVRVPIDRVVRLFRVPAAKAVAFSEKEKGNSIFF
jgi:hypothetical protein